MTPSVVLFTITNKDEYLTYGVYALKAYALMHLNASPPPKITIKIHRQQSESYESDNVSLKVNPAEIKKIAMGIVRLKPGLLGLSVSVINRRASMLLAKAVKRLDPHITIVIGGPETHHNYIYDSRSFMLSESSMDIIAKFEGEEIFLELIESVIYKRYGLEKIKGIVFRKNGKIIDNGERVPMDLKHAPSPYTAGVYKPRAHIPEYIVENSRGCPYRCAYCSYPAGINRFLRYFPAERVINDFKFLIQNKVKYINVADNNFNIHKAQFRQVLETIIKYNKGNHTKISSFFNASREIVSEDILRLLAESRLSVTIGIQSTNQDTLTVAKRGGKLDTIEKNLRLMDKHGVSYRLEFIYGLPGDTLSDIENTIDWIFEYRALWVFFYRLVVLKGTYFSDHSKELGLYYDEKAPFRVLKNRQLSGRELEKIERMLILVTIFYNKPALRQYMFQLKSVFRLPYHKLFGLFESWYDGPQNRLLNKRYINGITKRFMRHLFEHYVVGAVPTAKA